MCKFSKIFELESSKSYNVTHEIVHSIAYIQKVAALAEMKKKRLYNRLIELNAKN